MLILIVEMTSQVILHVRENNTGSYLVHMYL